MIGYEVSGSAGTPDYDGPKNFKISKSVGVGEAGARVACDSATASFLLDISTYTNIKYIFHVDGC